MVKRQCPKCKAIFDRKSHYDYHIKRKYACSPDSIYLYTTTNKTNTESQELQTIPTCSKTIPNCSKTIPTNFNEELKENINEITNDNLDMVDIKIQNLSCGFCFKKYSTKTNLNKHLKICKIKKENDNEKENIFKLLLEKDKQHKEELKLHKEEVSELKKQNQLLLDKIDKLINSTSTKSKITKNSNNKITNNNDNSINNNNQTNNTQNNIVMVNFGKEDLSIIDEKQFIDRVIKKPMLSGVKIPDEVLKIIHFNPQYPQLSNIYISDINREKCMVYEDGEWKLSSVDNIPQIMDKVCIFSADQINTLRTKHPNNKPLQDRLGIIEKYNNFIDGDYLEDLRDSNIDGTNQNQISRCEDFQAHTYNTLKKTLYNEGKKLKKTLNKK